MGSSTTRLNEPLSLSHGTLEIADLAENAKFYQEFLGLGFAQQAPIAGSVFHGSEWRIAAVQVKPSMLHPQGPANRWVLAVDRPEQVDEAREAALAHKDEYKIRQISEVEQDENAGRRSFMLEDAGNNWWEFRYTPGGPLKWVDDAFAKGDVA